MTIHRNDGVYRLPVGSLRIEELKRKSFWYRIKEWYHRNQIEIDRRIVEDMDREAKDGSLRETMRMLEEAER